MTTKNMNEIESAERQNILTDDELKAVAGGLTPIDVFIYAFRRAAFWDPPNFSDLVVREMSH